MNVIFLDFDGVITTYDSKWNIDLEKLALIDKIVQQTNAKIVVTSSWKCGCKDVDCFRQKLQPKRRAKTKTIFNKFLEQIYDITEDCEHKSQEVKKYLSKHKEQIENYVIVDDEDVFADEDDINFVQTDTYKGVTEKDVTLCIKLLNQDKQI